LLSSIFTTVEKVFQNVFEKKKAGPRLGKVFSKGFPKKGLTFPGFEPQLNLIAHFTGQEILCPF
jgi:hypothetical protein